MKIDVISFSASQIIYIISYKYKITHTDECKQINNRNINNLKIRIH